MENKVDKSNNSDSIENYEQSEEEKEMNNIMGLLSIYVIYYNKQNNTKGHLFTNINPFNKHSTNDRLMELVTHIKLYKSQPGAKIIKKDDEGKCKYMLVIKDKQPIYCTLLIPLLLYLSGKEWRKFEWNIYAT